MLGDLGMECALVANARDVAFRIFDLQHFSPRRLLVLEGHVFLLETIRHDLQVRQVQSQLVHVWTGVRTVLHHQVTRAQVETTERLAAFVRKQNGQPENITVEVSAFRVLLTEENEP